MDELGELLNEHAVFVNSVTWGGGDSTDLLDAFAQAQVAFPHFGRRWIDVQTWATLLSLARTPTGMVQQGGLSKAMARYKLQFVGKAHRADVDAFNTLRLFFCNLGASADLGSMCRADERPVSPSHQSAQELIGFCRGIF